MSTFNPKRVLRQLSGAMLTRFFQTSGHNIRIDGDQITPGKIRGMFATLDQYMPGAYDQLHLMLRDVDELATEIGFQALMEVGGLKGKPLPDYLDENASQHDRVLAVLLEHAELRRPALLLTRADEVATGRSWARRNNLHTIAPAVDSESIRELERVLSAYFRLTQGRGQTCVIEHLTRGEALDYFFVFISNYPNAHLLFGQDGHLERRVETPAFEIVFAFDHVAGVLEMYAAGGRPVVAALQEIFSQVMLGEQLRPEDPNKQCYVLDHLMDRTFGFPTDPQDGVVEVAVRKLKLSVVGDRRRFIVLDPGKTTDRATIYDMVEQDLDRSRLHRSMLHVARATIQMTRSVAGEEETFAFDVASPNRCNLKSQREEFRAIGEKYLRRWNIAVA